MSEDDRHVSIIALFRETARLMVADLVAHMAAAGYEDISGTHHPVFENIDLAGTRLNVLASRANLTHQSMSELVRTLESRGYVERVADPADRRARLVRLTPRGLRMTHEASKAIEHLERRWTEAWRYAGLDGDIRKWLIDALNERGGSPDRRDKRTPYRAEGLRRGVDR
jgi:DNA-binding MarR family transcriptional regulator